MHLEDDYLFNPKLVTMREALNIGIDALYVNPDLLAVRFNHSIHNDLQNSTKYSDHVYLQGPNYTPWGADFNFSTYNYEVT